MTRPPSLFCIKTTALLMLIGVGSWAALSSGGCDPCATCVPIVTRTPTLTPVTPTPATPTPATPTPATPTPGTPTPTPGVSSAGSGLFAVDCTRNLAYVPMLNQPDPSTGHGRVAVINTAANPNTTDPRVTTILLSHSGNPSGTALDPADSIIVVVSGGSGQGFVDLIDENTNGLISGSPFSFPTGQDTGIFGQVLFDPVRKKAIMNTIGTTTGFMTFDVLAHTFTPVIVANYAETFAFNQATNVVIDASDNNSAGSGMLVDVTHSVACTLSDSNIGGDQDGASIDFTTNIGVISNEDGTATAINLNGGSFSSTTPPCSFNEGGITPNSVRVSGLPGATAGSALNPVTHQAFLIEDGSNGITLLTLPAAPVTQLNPSAIPLPSIATIPNDPSGSTFLTQGDPYAVAVDTCHDFGYSVNGFSSPPNFLVQVDIAKFKANPSAIATPLPAGTCAGTSTTAGCSNGNGVVFFPLPSIPPP